jgi:hypothetical protein
MRKRIQYTGISDDNYGVHQLYLAYVHGLSLPLVIVLAKMHGDIETIKEKVRVLFDLWNNKND